MKLSIATMILLVVMTSYLCEGCYFTNCPNRWDWGKTRSTRSTDEGDQQHQLLDIILQKVVNKKQSISSLIESKTTSSDDKQSDYDEIKSNYDDLIMEKLINLLEHSTYKGDPKK